MTGSGDRFDISELSGADEAVGGASDLAAALAMAREIQSAVASTGGPASPAGEFVDRVMAAIEREPAPSAASVVARARRAGPFAGIVVSLREAWALAVSGAGRPLGTRAAALAYVLVIAVLGASLTGAAAYGAAGALGLLDGSPSRTPEATEPVPSGPPTSEPSESPRESVEPSETPDPSASPSGSPEGSGEPSGSPEGSGEPSGSPEESHEASEEPSDTPKATRTPDPSESPDPSDSPEPSGS